MGLIQEFSKKLLSILFLMLMFSSVAQEILHTSNLPIIIINTNGQQIPDEPKIDVDMGIIYNGLGELNHIDDTFNNYDGRIGIEIRGSTSQGFPKKSFGIETRDAEGNNLNVSLLGLPEENDFVLYAPYSDKSCIRNVLAYKLAESTGHYAPRTRYCELLINGVYMGIYVLVEKIKPEDNRVNIPNMSPSDTLGDNLTGGYIVQIGKYDPSGWYSPYNEYAFYQCYSPKDPEEQQLNYIHDWMDIFEGSMMSLQDDDTSFFSVIDKTSFIDYILVNEISKNPDGFRKSAFLSKEKESSGGILVAGPVWDYNIGFGNCEEFDSYIFENWVIDDTKFIYTPYWWPQLFKHSVFYDQLKERWRHLRKGAFHDNSINGIIDSCANILIEPQQRNFLRWDILGAYIWPNYFVGETYDDEVGYLKAWIAGRTMWMDEQLGMSSSIEEGSEIVRVYPNPFYQRLNVYISLPYVSQFEFKLIDFSGKVVFLKSFKNHYSGNIPIDLPEVGFSEGFYFFVVTMKNGETYSGKIIRAN